MNVTVTLADDADVDAVVGKLRRRGMAVDQVLDAIGVVVGSVEGDDLDALTGLDGVLAVEEDHTFQLPPPDSDVQ